MPPADLRTDAVAGQQLLDRHPRGGHRRAEGDVARAAVVAARAVEDLHEARVRERDRLAPQGRVDARDQLGVVAVQQALGLVGHRVEVRPQGGAIDFSTS